MSDALRDAIEDAVWGEVRDHVSAARVNRVVEAVLVVAQANEAEAVSAARQQALEGAAQAISANATRYTDEYLTTKAVASRLRRLSAEAGITVDAHIEEES